MNAIQQRPRRWSSRLSGMANNQTAATSTTNTLMCSNGRCEPACFENHCLEERAIFESPGCKLRPLPFYDHVCDLIRPAGLISDGIVGRINESQVEFKLTIDQADMLAMAPKLKQIVLRFCYLEMGTEEDDNFPPDISVSVNGASVVLPPAVSNPNKPQQMPKRPGQHLDITPHCKLCPYIQNVITIKWYVDPNDPARSYAVNVIIAEKVSTNVLLERIKQRGLSDPESTKRLILDSDNEVATTNLQSSLLCPLGKMRMSVPCKSIKCQHIPCFDALIYLQMNEKKASWICPVCYKPAYFLDLVIDGFFMDIIQQAAPNVTEVTLNLDGSWVPVMKMEQPSSAKNPPPEIITISDDDD